MKSREEYLEMAQEIDEMDRSVTAWEADFLDSVLPRLREGRQLSEKQAGVLEKMYRKYIHDDEG